jgi:hypothetical protein
MCKRADLHFWQAFTVREQQHLFFYRANGTSSYHSKPALLPGPIQITLYKSLVVYMRVEHKRNFKFNGMVK